MSQQEGSSSIAEVILIVGTRPEIIKMAPVIRAILSSDALALHLVHTGQHYDENMSGTFFESLNLPEPDTNFDIGSGSHGQQTASGISEIERLLSDRTPRFVLAQGDTNAVLSTAIAASKLDVEFGHIEAGIRSADWSMPEEINRVVADTVADLAFAPTPTARENLETEVVPGDVFVTGNTVVDACLEHVALAQERFDGEHLVNSDGPYAVATIHRPRNTDDSDRLERILQSLDGVDIPVVFPAHPRTQSAIEDAGYESTNSLRIVDPVDYLPFLALLNGARAVVTDSGGVQEEASILELPCLTVRPNTERPETVEAGVNRLIEPTDIANSLTQLVESDDVYDRMTGHPSLYGDGNAGEQIVSLLERRIADEPTT